MNIPMCRLGFQLMSGGYISHGASHNFLIEDVANAISKYPITMLDDEPIIVLSIVDRFDHRRDVEVYLPVSSIQSIDIEGEIFWTNDESKPSVMPFFELVKRLDEAEAIRQKILNNMKKILEKRWKR